MCFKRVNIRGRQPYAQQGNRGTGRPHILKWHISYEHQLPPLESPDRETLTVLRWWVDSCGRTDAMRYEHRAVYPTEMTSPPSLPVMPQSGGVVACSVRFMPSAGWVEFMKLVLWHTKPLYRLQTSSFLYLWLRLFFLQWFYLIISM